MRCGECSALHPSRTGNRDHIRGCIQISNDLSKPIISLHCGGAGHPPYITNMASSGLKVPRLDLGAGRAAEQQRAADASARASSGPARSRLLAITERVLAKSNAENVTPRLSSRVAPSVSRLSVRSKTPNPDDPPPTSRREGNSSRRNAGNLCLKHIVSD